MQPSVFTFFLKEILYLLFYTEFEDVSDQELGMITLRVSVSQLDTGSLLNRITRQDLKGT